MWDSKAMFCLTCVHKVFVTQWHNAWKMYNMKIRNCGLLSYGPCNLNGQHRWFGLDLLLQSSDGLCRQTQNAPLKHSLPCMYQTIRCPHSDHLINPHHSEHLKSHTKIYSELKHWWKCHVAKTELYKSTIYFYTIINITYFYHQLWTLLYIMSQKTEKTNYFHYKYTFYDQEHVLVRWISNLYYNYTTRKLNFWLWNKTAYMIMKS